MKRPRRASDASPFSHRELCTCAHVLLSLRPVHNSSNTAIYDMETIDIARLKSGEVNLGVRIDGSVCNVHKH